MRLYHEWIGDGSAGKTKLYHFTSAECAKELFNIDELPSFVLARNYKNYGTEIFTHAV